MGIYLLGFNKNKKYDDYSPVKIGVKYRAAVIDREWRPTLLSVIGNLINEAGCKTIIANGMENHVH